MNDILFKKLAFSESEILIYRAILKMKEATPVELHKITGIKRTTCYSLALGLCEKGFLYERAATRPKKFSLVPPHELKEILKHEQKQAKEREETLHLFVEQLSQYEARSTYPVPIVRFIEEAKLEKFFYKRSETWIKSLKEADSTWWGYQDSFFSEYYVDWIRSFFKKGSLGFEVKLLSNQSNIDKNLLRKYKERQIKVWPNTLDFQSTIWITGEYVTFIYCRETPMHAVEIHSALMARDLRTIFSKIWEE